MFKGQRETPRIAGATIKQQSELPPKNAYAEELKGHETPHIDPRPKMHKPLDGILVPRFNTLYDSIRSTQGWRYMADASAFGAITTAAGASTSVPVNLTNNPNWKLEQWPGAVQVYLAIRFFGIAPQAVPTANGGMECIFTDQFGNVAPLGEYLSQSGGNSNYDVILPTSITDPGNQTVGTLTVNQANVASSGGTFNWSIGFCAVYMLPSRYGYEIIEDVEYEQIDNKVHQKGKKHGHS